MCESERVKSDKSETYPSLLLSTTHTSHTRPPSTPHYPPPVQSTLATSDKESRCQAFLAQLRMRIAEQMRRAGSGVVTAASLNRVVREAMRRAQVPLVEDTAGSSSPGDEPFEQEQLFADKPSVADAASLIQRYADPRQGVWKRGGQRVSASSPLRADKLLRWHIRAGCMLCTEERAHTSCYVSPLVDGLETGFNPAFEVDLSMEPVHRTNGYVCAGGVDPPTTERPFEASASELVEDMLAKGILTEIRPGDDIIRVPHRLNPVVKTQDVMATRLKTGIIIDSPDTLQQANEALRVLHEADMAKLPCEQRRPFKRMKVRCTADLRTCQVNGWMSKVPFQYLDLDYLLAMFNYGPTGEVWLAQCDFRDFFWAFPVAEETKPFFCVWIKRPGARQYTMAQYERLPQGMKLSPYFVSAFGAVLIEILRAQGIQCFIFVDDLIVVGLTRAEADAALERAIAIARELGLQISEEKTVHATQWTTYLGMQFDTQARHLCLPEDKTAVYLELLYRLEGAWRPAHGSVARFVNTGAVQNFQSMHDVLELADALCSLLGRLQWCSQTMVSTGRSVTGVMYQLHGLLLQWGAPPMRCAVRRADRSFWEEMLHALQEARQGAQWWIQIIQSHADPHSGKCVLTSFRTLEDRLKDVLVVSTDASRCGCGGLVQRVVIEDVGAVAHDTEADAMRIAQHCLGARPSLSSGRGADAPTTSDGEGRVEGQSGAMEGEGIGNTTSWSGAEHPGAMWAEQRDERHAETHTAQSLARGQVGHMRPRIATLGWQEADAGSGGGVSEAARLESSTHTKDTLVPEDGEEEEEERETRRLLARVLAESEPEPVQGPVDDVGLPVGPLELNMVYELPEQDFQSMFDDGKAWVDARDGREAVLPSPAVLAAQAHAEAMASRRWLAEKSGGAALGGSVAGLVEASQNRDGKVVWADEPRVEEDEDEDEGVILYGTDDDCVLVRDAQGHVRELASAARELWGLDHALGALGPRIEHKLVLWITDATSGASAVNRFSGRSPSTRPPLIVLRRLCDAHDTAVVAIWVNREHLPVTDLMSRISPSSPHTPHRWRANTLRSIFGEADIASLFSAHPGLGDTHGTDESGPAPAARAATAAAAAW